MLWSIVAFIAVIAVLVLVHEFGHFYVAKKSGIEVEEFGFGFPPRIAKYKGKHTTYTINLLPLGGFVKLKGEDGGSSKDPNSFAHKSKRIRAGVVVAGVVMNLLLAAVLLSVGFMMGIPSVLSDDIDSSAKVSDRRLEILQVLEDSPAATAGVRAQDSVVSINGHEYGAQALVDLSELVYNHNQFLTLNIERGDEKLDIEVRPDWITETNRPGIGVSLIEVGIVKYAPHLALVNGITTTAVYTKEVVFGIGRLIGDLVTGNGVSAGVAGPVGIAALTGKVAQLGINHLIQFVAILSINLAVLNLIPFPALDGGRLLFIGIEAVRGKPVEARHERAAHMIGFALLMLLIIVVTIQDISRFGGAFSNFFKSVGL